MFKIKFFDIGSSKESQKTFNTMESANTELEISGFKFDINRCVCVRRQGKHYQEAMILKKL